MIVYKTQQHYKQVYNTGTCHSANITALEAHRLSIQKYAK